MLSHSQHSLTLHNGQPVTLRAARPEDAPDMIVIQDQVIAEGISNVGDARDTVEERAEELSTLPEGKLWLVAEHAGQVVGSLEMNRPGPTFMHHQRFLGIELHRAWRGVGLGSAMIRYAIEWAQAQGVEMIQLGVLDSNPRAKALYERLGFRQTGHIPRFAKRPDGSYAGDTQMVLFLDGE